MIRVETNARNTLENFINSKPKIDELNPEKVVIFTNKAHMKRAVNYAKTILGSYEIVACPTNPRWYDLKGQMLELACYIYEYTKIPLENLYKSSMKLRQKVLPRAA